MTNRLGFFDPTARALTTFDSTAVKEGWFDETLIPAGVSGPTSYVLTCAVGSYTYTGQTATLTYVPGVTKVNYVLSCAVGAYVYTGNTATLVVKRNYVLSLSAGAYTYSGGTATLVVKRNYVLQLAAGTYNYVGVPATLIVKRNYTLVCAVGAYSYSGGTATLQYTAGGTPNPYTLVCSAGSYIYTGQDVTLTYSPGVSPQIHYVLLCSKGSYVYSGTSAVLTYVSGAVTTNGQSRSKRFWTRQELDKYKTVEPAVKLIWIEEPKLAEKVATLVKQVKVDPTSSKQVERELVKEQLLAYLEKERQHWKSEYDRLILLEQQLLDQQRKAVANSTKRHTEKVLRKAEKQRWELEKEQQDEEAQIMLLLLNM